jgi:CRP/FNR family transcriptional regulator, cyclic AMP receptor protein
MAKFHPQQFLTEIGNGKTTLTCSKKQILFSQGDAAYAVFYIQTGKVRLSVASSQAKKRS